MRSWTDGVCGGREQPQLQLDGVRVLVGLADEVTARQLLAAADDTAGPADGD